MIQQDHEHEWVTVPGTDRLREAMPMVSCVWCNEPGWIRRFTTTEEIEEFLARGTY